MPRAGNRLARAILLAWLLAGCAYAQDDQILDEAVKDAQAEDAQTGAVVARGLPGRLGQHGQHRQGRQQQHCVHDRLPRR